MKTSAKKLSVFIISAILIVTSIMAPASISYAGVPITAGNGSLLTFAAWGDPQVSTYISSREKNVVSAANDLKNAQSKIDALVLAGDITENGSLSEYNSIYNDIVDTGVGSFITATGNHDIRIVDYSEAVNSFTSFTNKLNSAVGSTLFIDSLHYSYTVKGYKFIVLGSDETQLEEAVISNSQLNWLDSQLASSTNEGKPVFVIMHQVLKNTHGLPNTWGSSDESAGTVGAQSDKIQSILNKYKNVILITGHLHTGFGSYSYQKIDNIHSVNLPSIGVDNESGAYKENGLGYITDVYNNKVVFRARNFNQGIFVPEYDITINLDRVQTFSLSSESYTYNGKAKKPSVKLIDFNGSKISSSNYNVTYPSGRKNVGEYKIKIRFKNAYAGNPVIYKTFVIKPKGTSITSLTSSGKKITVKWKKQSTQTSGYQIEYSTSSKFKNAKVSTISKNSKTSKVISNLKSNKKYFVRVRTYKTVKVNGKSKKIYSSWSKAKAISVKK